MNVPLLLRLFIALTAVAPVILAAQTPTAAPAATAVAEAPSGVVPSDPSSPEELKKYPVDRYERIVKKSPFAFEIFAPEGPSTASPFADWKLAGYTIDEGKGIVYATLLNEKTGDKMVVDNTEPHRSSGIQLVLLERADKWSDSKVRLRKGSDEDVVEFSKKALEAKAVMVAPPAPAGQQQQQQGGRPGPANAANRSNAVQAQINQTLGTAPANAPPGTNPRQANLPQIAPPGAQAGGAPAVQPTGNQQRQGPSARRRVILPPPNR